jgi:HNH endonuclease
VTTRYRLEVGNHFDSAPAVLKAGDAAIGTWLLCALWSARNQTPGHIPQSVAEQYGRNIAAILLNDGLWERNGSDYHMIPSRYWRFTKLTHREKILASLRERIYRRDGYRCLSCGSREDLTLDHIHPKSLGGADTESNLQTLCRPCNSSKGARV